MRNLLRDFSPFLIVFTLLCLFGIALYGLVWFVFTLTGAALGLTICYLVIRLIERLAHQRLLR